MHSSLLQNTITFEGQRPSRVIIRLKENWEAEAPPIDAEQCKYHTINTEKYQIFVLIVIEPTQVEWKLIFLGVVAQ